jgi:hypothetical protein
MVCCVLMVWLYHTDRVAYPCSHFLIAYRNLTTARYAFTELLSELFDLQERL